MSLFVKATQEQKDFQKWQLAESERLQAEQEKVLAERVALMNTMTEEGWEEFLQAEAIVNARIRATTIKQYEIR